MIYAEGEVLFLFGRIASCLTQLSLPFSLALLLGIANSSFALYYGYYFELQTTRL